MFFWNKKKKDDPEEQVKQVKKYYMQVLGVSEEEAEKKARQRLHMGKNVGKKDD